MSRTARRANGILVGWRAGGGACVAEHVVNNQANKGCLRVEGSRAFVFLCFLGNITETLNILRCIQKVP